MTGRGHDGVDPARVLARRHLITASDPWGSWNFLGSLESTCTVTVCIGFGMDSDDTGDLTT